jgi:hypothetical protein
VHRAAAALVLAIGVAPPAAAAGPVLFNHVEIHVSPQTYKAIAASPLVSRDLGRFEERSTVRDGGKTRYSGAYLYGARTYLEFTDEATEAGPRHLAFGMWLDRQADLPPLLSRLAAVPGAKPELASTTRQLPAREIPWFSYLYPWRDETKPPAGLAAAVWVMSIDPKYLKARYPDLRPDDDGTTREKQYARLHDATRPFDDVDEVRLSVGAAEADWLAREFRALRVPERRLADDDRAFVASDTTFVVHRLKDPAARKVSFRLRLSRALPAQDLTLGDSRLTVKADRTALWEFPG